MSNGDSGQNTQNKTSNEKLLAIVDHYREMYREVYRKQKFSDGRKVNQAEYTPVSIIDLPENFEQSSNENDIKKILKYYAEKTVGYYRSNDKEISFDDSKLLVKFNPNDNVLDHFLDICTNFKKKYSRNIENQDFEEKIAIIHNELFSKGQNQAETINNKTPNESTSINELKINETIREEKRGITSPTNVADWPMLEPLKTTDGINKAVSFPNQTPSLYQPHHTEMQTTYNFPIAGSSYQIGLQGSNPLHQSFYDSTYNSTPYYIQNNLASNSDNDTDYDIINGHKFKRAFFFPSQTLDLYQSNLVRSNLPVAGSDNFIGAPSNQLLPSPNFQVRGNEFNYQQLSSLSFTSNQHKNNPDNPNATFTKTTEPINGPQIDPDHLEEDNPKNENGEKANTPMDLTLKNQGTVGYLSQQTDLTNKSTRCGKKDSKTKLETIPEEIEEQIQELNKKRSRHRHEEEISNEATIGDEWNPKSKKLKTNNSQNEAVLEASNPSSNNNSKQISPSPETNNPQNEVNLESKNTDPIYISTKPIPVTITDNHKKEEQKSPPESPEIDTPSTSPEINQSGFYIKNNRFKDESSKGAYVILKKENTNEENKNLSENDKKAALIKKLDEVLNNVFEVAKKNGLNADDVIKVFKFAHKNNGISNKAIKDDKLKELLEENNQDKDNIRDDEYIKKLTEFSKKFQEKNKEIKIFSAKNTEIGLRTKRFIDVFGNENFEEIIKQKFSEQEISKNLENVYDNLNITEREKYAQLDKENKNQLTI